MVLTCGDRESPGQMMRLTAVAGNALVGAPAGDVSGDPVLHLTARP
jgi:hypothetical protein